jgi:phosphatidylglycerol---prolipoprotein diacylglyceryl transferase
MIEIPISPVIFYIGPVRVGWYGVMVALAVITVVGWALYAVKKDPRLTGDMILNAAIIGIPFGIVGARLLHVIDNWSLYSHDLGRIIGGDGLAIYGAVLGAALGVWIYSRFKKIPYGHIVDVLAPGIILAQAVGRVGCTLNGCCYGEETHLPWAITYTHPETLGPQGIFVHPTQVYEIIFNLIVFGILLMLRKRLRPDGSLFMVYLSLYSIWRIAVDFIREGKPFLFGLHEAQIISIVILVITISLMAWKTRWVKKGEAEEDIQKPTV